MPHPAVKRVRDPVHNLIEFGATKASREIELALWQVIQTPPFQRLRRIKQLGFSELVFPGATHTRFAHSLGVFHTARLLLGAVERSLDAANQTYQASQANVALAAALVHDVGHGMFSHAFEAVGKELNLPLARHETVSDRLIRDSEISQVLDREVMKGFAANVADLVGREQPQNVYDSIVTSQFDADRLDYMQRDRMMTGLASSTVDVTWLAHNLEVAPVRFGVDEQTLRTVDTLVLGPKAFHVAESYVLALFHLYPNVYLHKATRGAEQVLQDLIRCLFEANRSGQLARTGLPDNHPLLRFVREPHMLERAQALDDTVLWGALPMLIESGDTRLSKRARQLRDRSLLKAVDIERIVSGRFPPDRRETAEQRDSRKARINLACQTITGRAAELPAAMFDDYERNPYKRYQESRTPPNQIHINMGSEPRDMAELSSTVANAEPFRVCRAYVDRGDTATESALRKIIETSLEVAAHE